MQDSVGSLEAIASVSLMGLRLARLDRYGLLDGMFASLARGAGGWLVTANLDFLRRYVRDPSVRELYDAADVRIADGMPLVWACRIQGQSVPERVPGSSLVWLMLERAAREGRSVCLLGGAAGANERAGKVIVEKYPSLRLASGLSPQISSPPAPGEVDSIVEKLAPFRPDILLVGMGSPKQEQLIRALRGRLPATWMVGVGISLSFLAGDLKRAPVWMQRMGAEWIHRMVQDPRRLAKRYLVEDLPFAIRMFLAAAKARSRAPNGLK